MAISTQVYNAKIRVGDTIRVYQTIQEEGKTRTQAFEGTVIAIRGRDTGKSFTVRKISSGGIGVERIWPVLVPTISKVTVTKRGNVRRSKLYYLRKRFGREATEVKAKKISRENKKVSKESARVKKISGNQG